MAQYLSPAEVAEQPHTQFNSYRLEIPLSGQDLKNFAHAHKFDIYQNITSHKKILCPKYLSIATIHTLIELLISKGAQQHHLVTVKYRARQMNYVTLTAKISDLIKDLYTEKIDI